MNQEELFDKFPELVLGSFRQQMLLGIVPAETVGSVLEPLLENFWDVMPRLSPDLQADFENILRVYPDVAARFGLRMKPPIETALPALAEYLLDRERRLPIEDAGAAILDLAAEEQADLEPPKRRVLFEGQGFFQTDKGNSVYLEFSYTEGDDSIAFDRKPIDVPVDILIHDRLALSLRPGEPGQRIGIERFVKLCKEGTLPEMSIKVLERR